MNREILIEEDKVLKLKNTLIREFKIDEEPLEKNFTCLKVILKCIK